MQGVRELSAVLVVGLGLGLAVVSGCDGAPGPLPAEVRARRDEARTGAARAVGAAGGKQILFGDLHVHTTLSADAFAASLPLVQGEGLHPPADACDYARFCAQLDFWSINDHAESLTPADWARTRAEIERCNAAAGDPADPDTVAFLGFEWTQSSSDPRAHYGHRNVVLLETAADRVLPRPVAAAAPDFAEEIASSLRLAEGGALPADEARRYAEFAAFLRERSSRPPCPADAPPDAECALVARTPADLGRELDAWGGEALVIPHGTTWGSDAPRGASLDPSLATGQHDPERQRLIEVYSGHGSAEVFRPWTAVTFDGRGRAVCPAPGDGYVPCCWRAGEIIEARCLAEGVAAERCRGRAAAARRAHVAAGARGHLTVPGATLDDWGMCGQCADCFLPAYDYRPRASAQYALARSGFEPGEATPRRFRFGLIASSDNHAARPGNGYKERDRRLSTDARGGRDAGWSRAAGFERPPEEPVARARRDPVGPPDKERAASFFLTGGLVAVHAEGRDRRAIWRALRAREAYATSGDAILLWFDLLNPPGPESAAPLPMGGEVRMTGTPRFRVRAVGASVQRPGCPETVRGALPPERLALLCGGECNHPGDERHRIAAVEVVRIRPQREPGEPIGGRIEDPWRSFPCPDDVAGCVVEFDDPEFASAGRDAVYYVRALQEPTEAVNGGLLRCEADARGRCMRVRPCLTGYRGDPADDCLAEIQERAWSSPIFVDHAPPG